MKTSMRLASVLLAMVGSVVACGGSTDSGSSGSSSGGSSSGGGPGDCTTETLPGDRACVPPTALAGNPIELEIEAEGCLGCTTTVKPCKVDVSGTAITLTLEVSSCPQPDGLACPASCGIPQAKCTVPALAAGTYSVALKGEGARTGLPPRELVVKADGAASSCELPDGAGAPAPLDPSGYSRACAIDADCALVTSGNLCGPCGCPNTAIARSGLEAFEAEVRALSSQCQARNDGIACSACQAQVARCETSVCQVRPAP